MSNKTWSELSIVHTITTSSKHHLSVREDKENKGHVMQAGRDFDTAVLFSYLFPTH